MSRLRTVGVIAAALGVAALVGCSLFEAQVPVRPQVARELDLQPEPGERVVKVPVGEAAHLEEAYRAAIQERKDRFAEEMAAAVKAEQVAAVKAAEAAKRQVDANTKSTARQIRALQEDLEERNAAAAQAASDRAAEAELAVLKLNTTAGQVVSRIDAEAKRVWAFQSADIAAAQKRQETINGVLSAGLTIVGGAAQSTPWGAALTPLLAVAAGGLGLGWVNQRRKTTDAETKASYAEVRATDNADAVEVFVKAIADLGKDRPDVAAKVKRYIADHGGTGKVDDLVEAIKYEFRLRDDVKAEPLPKAA